MCKHLVILCLFTVSLLAGPFQQAPMDVAKWTEPAPKVPLTHSAVIMARDVVYIDSSINQYGYWTSMQDPIKGVNDTAVILTRRYGDGTLGSGALGLIWTIVGVALTLALWFSSKVMAAAAWGLLPIGLGVAFLLIALLERKKKEEESE